MQRAVLVLVLFVLVAPQAAAETLDPGYWERTPLPQAGLATFYAAGLMEHVQDYRLAQAEIPRCPECVGAVALLRAGDIGRKVWLQPPGGEPVGPFLVVDCARRQDVAPLVSRNWAVDVSYELGQLWGMVRPLAGVTVLEDPADALNTPDTSYRAPTPFAVSPDQVVISAPTATPAAPPPAATPWPTRLPHLLPGGTWPEPATTTPASGPPAATPGPPPLTPVVTTPTPQATLEAAGQSLLGTATPTEQPSEPISEVSLGHAGAGLLDPLATPVRQLPAWPTASVTPRSPTRTPRPDLTPILPATGEGAALTPESNVGFFARLWQQIIDAITP